jgi:hypothetical protein
LGDYRVLHNGHVLECAGPRHVLQGPSRWHLVGGAGVDDGAEDVVIVQGRFTRTGEGGRLNIYTLRGPGPFVRFMVKDFFPSPLS